jgi:hypothetical protein
MDSTLTGIQVVYVVAAGLLVFCAAVAAVGTWRR